MRAAIDGGRARLDSSLVRLETLGEERSEIQALVDELLRDGKDARRRLPQPEPEDGRLYADLEVLLPRLQVHSHADPIHCRPGHVAVRVRR